MTRVKRGTISKKKHKKIKKATKGMIHARRSSVKKGREALFKAWQYQYRDRKAKKREFRKLWIIRLNAALREEGTTYSAFMAALKKQNILLDRKVLAELAVSEPEVFKKLVEQVGSQVQK